jgi:preprotein translocase subunit YajC
MIAIVTLLAKATTTTTKSSGSSAFLLPLLVVAAAYLLFLRPRQQKAKRAQQAARTGYEVGDRVQSIGGIKGTVLDIDGDDIRVEVADGVVLTFAARAVQAAPPVVGGPVAGGASYDDDVEDHDVVAGGAPVEVRDGFTADGRLDDVEDEPVIVPDDVDSIDFGDSSSRAPTDDPDEGPGGQRGTGPGGR